VWNSPARLLAPDAEDESDLARLADLLTDARLLPCGALALARAWRLALGAAPAPAGPPRLSHHGPFVLACGSANPAARHLAQAVGQQTGAVQLAVTPGHELPVAAAQHALKSRLPVVLLLEPLPARAALAAVSGALRAGPDLMAEVVRQVCALHAPAGLLLMGGETARSALQAVAAGAVWVSGELAPGLAWGRLMGGLCDGRWLITQSGGLSAAASLTTLSSCLLDFCE
jgi:uncharacterized protein YgbK (DUF1537 family)